MGFFQKIDQIQTGLEFREEEQITVPKFSSKRHPFLEQAPMLNAGLNLKNNSQSKSAQDCFETKH